MKKAPIYGIINIGNKPKRKVLNYMIYQNSDFVNSENKFFKTFKDLKISSLLRKANINKNQGFSAFEIFKFLFFLVFQGKSLFRFLNSKHKDEAVSKNTYYRFLSETSYNWEKFLLLLSAKVISFFDSLTTSTRVKVLILDDSVVSRNRSKKVELLAKIYDHSIGKYVRGFNMLTLGWSDGFSFIPVAFNMLSSAKSQNRYTDLTDKIDKRSIAYKRRKSALLQKPQAVMELITKALDFGITADYVLMDTWFTNEPLIKNITDTGLDVIGMVKQLRQHYIYEGEEYTLNQLYRRFCRNKNNEIQGSICVKTKNHGINVKIVFIRNKNNKKEWLSILSTDLSISDEEIVRIYGMRWSIETFFKASKSLFKLGSEFQGRTYDMTVSHTTIVFARYILLEWIRRNDNDYKTIGGLFYMFCDDVQDITYETAIMSLMSLFINTLTIGDINVDNLKCQVMNWLASQVPCIRNLFADFSWES